MQNRIRQIRKILKEEKIDALLISSTYNIFYVSGFSGFHDFEREGYALLTSSNLYIFATPLQAEGVRRIKGDFKVIELSPTQRLIPTLQEIITKENIKHIGFEENLTYAEYKNFKKLKGIKLSMPEEIIEEVRIEKDISELSFLRKACDLTDKTYSYVRTNIRMGVTELELEWEIEKYIRENGGRLAFPSKVAFGENSAIPHHDNSDKKLTKDSIVLLDFGAKIDGYCADMTRTFFMGKADEKFRKVYEAVRVAQELPFDTLRVSVSESRSPRSKKFSTHSTSSGQAGSNNINPDQVDKIARDYIISQGFPSIPHSVGHGVGLEVHELPHISPGFKEEIFPNTPFTIEPGIYINGYGGVRIEDTVFYDGKQIISLTNSPKELLELSS